MNPVKRKRKLIRPGLQLRLIVVFLCVAASAVILQAIALNRTMLRVAEELPNDGTLVLSHWPDLFATNVLVTLAVLVPTTLVIGLAATNRVAGPLHRVQLYLEAVKRGDTSRSLDVRGDDELGHFCQLLVRTFGEDRRRPAAVSVSHGLDDRQG
jgi:hypothetical protein